MKSVIATTLLTFLTSTQAFTGIPLVARTSENCLKMATVFEEMPGAVDFRLNKFEFDPLGFSETYSPFRKFFREAELRHGRTAMLAVLGWIAADFVRIPGEAYSFASVPSSAVAHELLLAGPMHQLLLWVTLFDILITYPAIQAMNDGEREPGDYGLLTFAPSDPELFKKKQESELLNGRLAMIAIGGISAQSVLTGHSFPYL